MAGQLGRLGVGRWAWGSLPLPGGAGNVAAAVAEQNRKTLRSFYCRDYLWELFEVMTRDLGCSMDYLINEAMRHYARSRNYSLAGGGQSSAPGGYGGGPPPSPPGGGPYGGGGYGQPPPGYPPAGSYGGPGGRPTTPGAYGGGGYGQPPAAQGGYAGTPQDFPPAAPQRPAPPPAPPRPAADPSPGPPPPPAPAPEALGQPPLFLTFNGQKYKIDKEKFIIGRGSQMTDLTIRDGNISRKHAAIIFRGGKYYLKDLDSTNGIDYQGSRIDSKKVEEGDVFHICDYELRFSMLP